MGMLSLLFAGLRRKPLRSVLTLASLSVAFLLFGLLAPVANLFSSTGSSGTESRLWVSPKHSISDMLPVNYSAQIANIEGVAEVAHQTWFGGTYIDSANAFTRWAVTPESFLRIYPEFVLTQQEHEAFVNSRTGAILGRATAERFDLEVGDRLPLMADIWHNQDGSAWDFEIVGIYDALNETVDDSMMFISYEFFDEYRIVGKGSISNVIVALEDSSLAGEVTTAIDVRFANSAMETATATEREWLLTQIRQMGNIGLIIQAVMLSVFFTLLLLTGNTVAHSFREQIPELAVLKTIGFQRLPLLGLVFGQSLVLCGLGAGIGLVLAALLMPMSTALVPQFAGLAVAFEVFVEGALWAIVLALMVSVGPVTSATKLEIVDALRRG